MALHRFARLTAVMTFILLMAGSLVTSTNSGLSVPDWPLSYGTFFPPLVGGIFYEHSHRLVAAAVGVMMAGLAGWLWLKEPRRWVRRLGSLALAAVFAQAILGGLTVLWALPPLVSVAHACLGQAVFCLIVCIAACTSPRWVDQPVRADDPSAPSLQTVSLAVAGLAGLQLVLGAVIRHSGAGVSWHLLGASGLLGTVAWVVVRVHRASPRPVELVTGARHLALLLVVQVILGGVTLWHRDVVSVKTAHVLVGALVLAQAVLLAWQAQRFTQPLRVMTRLRVIPEQVSP